MSDKEPLLFRKQFGGLRPVTAAAEQLLANAKEGETIRIEAKQLRGNVRRMAWYWVMLKLATEQLSDAVDGVMTTHMLHRFLKRHTGRAKPITSKKTGEVIDYDYDSIAFDKMTEAERAEYIDQSTDFLSRRLGVDTNTLRREAQQQAA